MMILLFAALQLSTPAVALTSAEGWADFADNFATDLAPLITLFGEQVTKQFFSESTGFLDNIIFGLAPLGIITAVVSAIRLYGKASLKSFIGRAQEAHGVAEAELCSSTSQDVCELWSNGGICRVFGSPKILEFIYIEGGKFYPLDGHSLLTDDDGPPHCGISLPKDVLNDVALSGMYGDWFEADTSFLTRGPLRFAPYPNLSLNVSTKRRNKRFLLAVASFGFLLQASFFIYATWATFYNASFYVDSDKPQLWSFVLGMAGTAFVVCGMTLCAFLVDRRSTERRFRYKEGKAIPRIHWLQCGNQRVGDQQFRSFAFSKEKEEYVTSYIDEPGADILGLHPEIALLLAITSSLVGFACQFVGFRGLHGSITLYQLACTLLIPMIRAWLRSSRLHRDQNQLDGANRVFESHELDWQALHMIVEQITLGSDSPINTIWWELSSWRLDTGLQRLALAEAAYDPSIVVSEEKIGSGIVGFRLTYYSPPYLGMEYEEARCFESAVQIVRMLEGDGQWSNEVFNGPLPVKLLRIGGASPGTLPQFKANVASRALYIRARLCYVTGDELLPPGSQWDPELQGVAKRLQTALQEAAGYIFREVPLKDGSWKSVKALIWSASCEFTIETSTAHVVAVFPIHSTRHLTTADSSNFRLSQTCGPVCDGNRIRAVKFWGRTAPQRDEKCPFYQCKRRHRFLR
ncbi:hypothetical protein F5144DRAFT_570182 [Chaetomium tenue]|uniref:Uncharacterized protein n=1 Tax=Chaetomium tenue TaxID=1854479 RepID=A0ACB7PG46_9PEZI|nr:hypothetical protein F5144DRAFT_570182 [Chaetomium globosum]